IYGDLKVWDADTGAEAPGLVLLKQPGGVRGLSCSPDSGRLAWGTASGTARVWDARAGRGLFRLPQGNGVTAAACSPDGRRLAVGTEDMRVTIWDLETRRKERSWDTKRGSVLSLVFSPDGRRIVSGSLDPTVQVRDVLGQPLFLLRGHTGDVA